MRNKVYGQEIRINIKFSFVVIIILQFCKYGVRPKVILDDHSNLVIIGIYLEATKSNIDLFYLPCLLVFKMQLLDKRVFNHLKTN